LRIRETFRENDEEIVKNTMGKDMFISDELEKLYEKLNPNENILF